MLTSLSHTDAVTADFSNKASYVTHSQLNPARTNHSTQRKVKLNTSFSRSCISASCWRISWGTSRPSDAYFVSCRMVRRRICSMRTEISCWKICVKAATRNLFRGRPNGERKKNPTNKWKRPCIDFAILHQSTTKNTKKIILKVLKTQLQYSSSQATAKYLKTQQDTAHQTGSKLN